MARRPSRPSAPVAVSVKPKFAGKSTLTRYVDEVQRLGNRRPAPDVFRANPGDGHLSVNLLGVERLTEIVSYYRERFQENAGKVGICQHKVQEYNQACHLTKVTLMLNRSEGAWEFLEGNNVFPAYRLRPFTPKGSRHSLSHSGVEYVRLFNETDELKFARRMCNKRFHLL
jgi:hypothetical protein